jgi:hypothetical protein
MRWQIPAMTMTDGISLQDTVLPVMDTVSFLRSTAKPSVMAAYCVMCTTKSWKYPLAAGTLSILLGVLLFLEPALSLRLFLYSLGIIAVVIAAVILAGAAFFSRGSGPLAPLLLVIGILVLAMGVTAFINPGLLGGVMAVIAAAVLIVGGLGMACTGVFQGETLPRRLLMALGGIILAILGFMVLFHTAFTTVLIVRLFGLFFLVAGVVSVAGAVVLWWQGRSCQPGWIDAELVEK